MEAAVALLVRIVRETSKVHVVPQEVRLPHASPRHTLELQRWLGCPVRLGQSHTMVVFDRRDLDLPMVDVDEVLAHHLTKRAEEVLRALPPADESLEDHLRHHLRMTLGEAPLELNMGRAAAALGTSSRSLRRHLHSGGTSFSDILESVKCEAAKRLLRHHDFPVSQIAASLGYSEPKAFRRAFYRWTGMAPSAFRSRA
jgi:AraC-like DNA-binding protein